MTAMTKSALTRKARSSAYRLCERHVRLQRKGTCPGCTLQDAADMRDYPKIQQILTKYQRILEREAKPAAAQDDGDV